MGFVLYIPMVAEAVSKAEEFRQRDPSGGVMSIIAISIVFFALVCVSLVVRGYGAVMQHYFNKPVSVPVAAVPKKSKSSVQQLDECIAAIGLAVRLYQEEQHIHESHVITINRASRLYSPWSSKIHGITQLPDKK